MPNTSLTIEQVLTLLEATPQRIAALTADVVPDQLHKRPSSDEWSANDVLAHLRSCADVWVTYGDGEGCGKAIAADCAVLWAVAGWS